MTERTTMTIAQLAAAARAFGCEDPGCGAMAPSALYDLAGVVYGRELIDGHHRTSALVAWADGDEDRLAVEVAVVVTDDEQLLDEIMDRKDRGEDEVNDLIDAALEG